MARVWADGAYAGQLVEWAEKTAECRLPFPITTSNSTPTNEQT